MPKLKESHLGLALLVVAGVVGANLVAMKLTPVGSADRIATVMEEELRRQGVDTALQARLLGAPESDAARSLGAGLARRGIARLTSEQLQERMALLFHMDSTATEEQCAARFMGTLAPADMQQMIGTLDDQQLELWAQISVSAIRLELHPEVRPPVPPTEEEVADAFAQVRRHLPSADGARFVSVMQDVGAATVADRCWVALTVARATSAMPDPPQAQVLVTLAKLEAGL